MLIIYAISNSIKNLRRINFYKGKIQKAKFKIKFSILNCTFDL